MATNFFFVWFLRKTKDVTIIGIFCYLSIYYMSIVWLAQISASFGFEIYKKKLENSENLSCHGNGEENQ